MSKEKQIKEIARVLCDAHEPCSKCVWGRCDVWNTATRLYNAGYRKQSEGEWYVNYMTSKTPSKRGRIIHYETYTCSACGKNNGRKKQNYCPNCGAKMKGGAE